MGNESTELIRRLHPAFSKPNRPARHRPPDNPRRSRPVDAEDLHAERAASKLLQDAAAEAMLWTLESGLRGTQLLLGAALNHEDLAIQDLCSAAWIQDAATSHTMTYAADHQARRSHLLREEQQRLQEQLWRARIDLGQRASMLPPTAMTVSSAFNMWRRYYVKKNAVAGRDLRALSHLSYTRVHNCFYSWSSKSRFGRQVAFFALKTFNRHARNALRTWSRQRRRLRVSQMLASSSLLMHDRIRAWRTYADAQRHKGLGTRAMQRKCSIAKHSLGRIRMQLLIRRWRLFAARVAAGKAAFDIEQQKLLPQRLRFEAAINAYRSFAQECRGSAIWGILRMPPPHTRATTYGPTVARRH